MDKMFILAGCATSVIIGGIAGLFLAKDFIDAPEDHLLKTPVAYSDKMCYQETPTGIVFTCRIKLPPVVSWGSCGPEELYEIKIRLNGDLAYCTPTGWIVHQPDN